MFSSVAFGRSSIHLSDDRVLNAFVKTRLAQLGFARFPLATSLMAHENDDVLQRPHREAMVPYGRRYQLLFTLQGSDTTPTKPRKLCLLLTHDAAGNLNGNNIALMTLVVPRDFYKDTLLECVYDDKTQTMHIVDVYWFCGVKAYTLDVDSRAMHAAMAAVQIMWPDARAGTTALPEQNKYCDFVAVQWVPLLPQDVLATRRDELVVVGVREIEKYVL